MMGEAAKKLAIDLIVQTPKTDDPAVKIASDTILAAVDDANATAELARRCDVITFENEFIDLEALKSLESEGVRFYPRLDTLSPLLDKYHQRSYLKQIGLPVPDFMALEPDTSPDRPFPFVLKARRHGYDGRGTFIVKSQADLDASWEQIKVIPLLVEEFIPFERELAVIAARSLTGEVVIYPVVETQQKEQVCRWVIVSAEIPPTVKTEVEAIARHLLEQLQAIGVFGIELFLTSEGKVLVNEIAPRTHNSGHYSLDACEISQFEMQLRAVTGLPLESAALNCHGAVMVNLLGYERAYCDYREKRDRLAAIPYSHLHWYGKSESRPGRKLGHITVLLEAPSEPSSQSATLLQTARTIESLWYE